MYKEEWDLCVSTEEGKNRGESEELEQWRVKLATVKIGAWTQVAPKQK